MCYKNGYGFRCGDCMYKEKPIPKDALKGMTKEDLSNALRVLQTLYEFSRQDGNPEKAPAYMIAFTPGEPMKIITENNACSYLPCFGEEDVIEQAPDLALAMSYDGQLLFQIGDQKYLDGTALIYAVDDEGEVISLDADDIYRVQQMIERRTMYVEEEGDRMPVLSLN